MKKIALFVTAIAVSLSIGGKAFADTTAATLADKAGITPDNVILYPIDKAIDNIKIVLAFGDEKKAEVLTDIAEERLGDSEVMADKGKTDLSIQTLNEYNDKITEAQDKVEDAIDKASSDTTSSAVSGSTDNTAKLDELKNLETDIASKQMYSLEVLKNVESKLSGNAKETIAQVIEMQTRKKEAIAEVAKERQTLLQDKKAVKEAEKSLEQAKKSGDAQAIKTAENALNQAQQSLTTQNEKFAQAVTAKKEAMKGGVGQLKKQAKKDQKEGTNDTATSTNNTTSGNSTSATGTAPATSSDATGTTTTTSTDATTNNATSTATQSTVTSGATTTTVKEKKGQEKKAEKENKGQEVKAEKSNH